MQQYTYLALGDSYTIGESVSARENFPNQTVELLRSAGYNFKDPVIVAKTGWTTGDLTNEISKGPISSTYDFVTLLIGVNNQYRGRSAEDYKAEFENLLQTSIQFADGKTNQVIVLSIPDWGVTPFATGRDRKQIAVEIDTYNSIIKSVSNKSRVHYVDITPGTRETETDQTLLARDGLHPSGKEYSRWAQQVYTIISNVLR